MIWLLKRGAIFYGNKGEYIFFKRFPCWYTPMPIEEV